MQVTTIAEQLFFTTVRIDTVAANGAAGSGTGFLFLHKVGEQGFPFVVTNKHVVNGMKAGALEPVINFVCKAYHVQQEHVCQAKRS